MTNHYRNLTNMNENRVYPTGVQSQFGTSAARTSAPPLPPRPFQTQSNAGIGMGTPYGSSYSNYGGYGNSVGGYGGYGGYGMGSMGYSGYGGLGAGYGGYGTMYGGGYNRFGAPFGANNMESRFIQMVEDSSRPAFQSIESVVGAFSGIAAMLDSTYMAMTSSFRAILGVAENFGRLRSLFAQFWSTFAVLRGLNWIYRKLLSLLGIRTQDAGKAEAWANALNSSAQGKKTSSWPILMFLGIIVAAPYIILKLFGGLNRTIIEKCSDPTTWPNTIPATVLYDLSNVCSGELPLRASQTVHIAPADIQQQLQLGSTGWVLATIDNKTSGLVPTNYIKVISPVQGNNLHAKNTLDGAYVRPAVNDFQFDDSLPVIHENSWKEHEQKTNTSGDTETTQFEEQPL